MDGLRTLLEGRGKIVAGLQVFFGMRAIASLPSAGLVLPRVFFAERRGHPTFRTLHIKHHKGILVINPDEN